MWIGKCMELLIEKSIEMDMQLIIIGDLISKIVF